MNDSKICNAVSYISNQPRNNFNLEKIIKNEFGEKKGNRLLWKIKEDLIEVGELEAFSFDYAGEAFFNNKGDLINSNLSNLFKYKISFLKRRYAFGTIITSNIYYMFNE